MYDEYELTGLEEHLRDSEGGGDPRRCPRHPHVKTSSDDGMFDAPCGVCEGEMSQAAEEWDFSSENPHRPFCKLPTYIARPYVWHEASCTDMVAAEDNIPF